MRYQYVNDVIQSFFNYSHGLSTDGDEARLMHSLANNDYKRNLTGEVIASLGDPDFSWLGLLRGYDFAQNHEIETESAARLWAKEQLLETYLA